MEVIEAIPEDLQVAINAIPSNDIVDSIVTEQRSQLNALVREQGGGAHCSIRVVSGRPFLEIIRAVLQEQFDLVIKPAGAAHKSIGRIGSTDMHLLRKCPCPVWIMQPNDASKYTSLLAAVDIDADEHGTDVLSRQILEMSTSLALADSSDLHIVHAWSLAHESFLRSHRSGIDESEVDAMMEEEKSLRAKWLAGLVDDIGGRKNSDAVDYLKPRLHMEKGHPQTIIPRLAEEHNVELIVMGTLGRSGISGFFMGNTSEEILKQVSCSILAIKPPGFVSPVNAR